MLYMGIEELDNRELYYTLLDCIDEYRHFSRLLEVYCGSDIVDYIGEVGHFMVSQYRRGRSEAVREFNRVNSKNKK